MQTGVLLKYCDMAVCLAIGGPGWSGGIDGISAAFSWENTMASGERWSCMRPMASTQACLGGGCAASWLVWVPRVVVGGAAGNLKKILSITVRRTQQGEGTSPVRHRGALNDQTLTSLASDHNKQKLTHFRHALLCFFASH